MDTRSWRIRRQLQPDRIYPSSNPFEGEFDHAILTRFALRIGFRPPELDVAAWLAHRIPIFLGLTLPSVLSQTIRPSRWYLGVNVEWRDTIAPVRQAIEPYPWIEIAWQEKDENPFPSGHDLTSRLDNDDALAPDYIAVAQAYTRHAIGADSDGDFWISFPFGAQAHGDRVAAYVFPTNHFLTRRNGSALGANHMHVLEARYRTYLAFTARPMWLEVVHGQNVKNRPLPLVEFAGIPDEFSGDLARSVLNRELRHGGTGN